MSYAKEFENLRIQLQEVEAATNNFSRNNLIGKGGFGQVYSGELKHSEGQTMVAVKRLDRRFGQGDPEFWKEIMMLSRYKHENLVSLLGFCDERGQKIIIYEYVHHGSLDSYLDRTDLTWIQRMNICIGAARGLEYLHNPRGSQQRVLHRDIKSSNILLDENWKAKISDFGLSKIGPANQQFSALISYTVGTPGYVDPLYYESGLLTKESDVYSFGVVLFEVLCGRTCIMNEYNDDRRSLPQLAQKFYDQKKLILIIDDNLRAQMKPECLDRFSTIAYRCLRRDREDRPSMTEIVNELEIALACQESDASLALTRRAVDASSLRQENVYMAKLAEKVENYERMVELMEKIVAAAANNGEDLKPKERNLLSIAYENLLLRHKSRWSTVCANQEREESRGNKGRSWKIRDDRYKIESEMSSICYSVVKLLDSKLIGIASTGDSMAFYLKMKGDYYRYLAEFKTGSEKDEAVENAGSAYKAAKDIASKELVPAHPVQLGLALSIAVFNYEILNSHDEARDIANEAFYDSLAGLDNLKDDSYKESTEITQLIRDKLALWNSSGGGEDDEEEDEGVEEDDFVSSDEE